MFPMYTSCRVAYHKGGKLFEGTVEAIDEKHGKVGLGTTCKCVHVQQTSHNGFAAASLSASS